MIPRTHANTDKSGIYASADTSVQVGKVLLTVFPPEAEFIDSVLRVRPYEYH